MQLPRLGGTPRPRGPRGLQGAITLNQKPRGGDRPPNAPKGFPGTLPEWFVYWALLKLKAEFSYQTPLLGGRSEKGGAVVDFVVYQPVNAALRVQGDYWHYRFGSEKKAYDDIQRIALENLGLIVIDLSERNIIRNPIFYTSEALRLREYPP